MIDELPYTAVSKTFLRTTRRFWRETADFSVLYSDTQNERLFNLSSELPGQAGLLLNWINGIGLDAFASLDADRHSERVIAWLETVWPGAAQQVEGSLTIKWSHSYAGGAYAHFAPGQLRPFAVEIPRPLGAVHFAGEHTELVAPGLEGAITSGIRAAREVIDSLS